jgi:phospholipid-binding lipoprotein MlaA
MLPALSLSRSVWFRTLALGCMLSAGLMGCASDPQNARGDIASDAQHDPLEPVNRVVFDVNDFFDRLLFKPLAQAYRAVTPTYVRNRLSGVMSNMNEPVVMANRLMQGRVTEAGQSLGRLVVNSTLGVGGAFDVADEGIGWGTTAGDDFGKTLHVWGVGQGPYIVLPLFGPSTLRDAAGKGVDMVMAPWGYVAKVGPHSTSSTFSYTSTGVGALVAREAHLDELDKLKEGSIDFYAQLRSLYLQYRSKQIGALTAAPTSASYDE